MILTFDTINITRLNDTGYETIGMIDISVGNKSVHLDSLELPWKDNQEDISCIPKGRYKYHKWFSPHFNRMVFRLEDVPDRTNILIHPANFVRQLRGCIAPGIGKADIDRDGKMDVERSVSALENLLEIANETGYVNIM